MRLGIDAIHMRIIRVEILSHSSRSIFLGSSIECSGKRRLESRSFIVPHTFSIGFKSGDLAGHFILFMVSSAMLSWTIRARCGRALLSTYTNSSGLKKIVSCLNWSVPTFYKRSFSLNDKHTLYCILVHRNYGGDFHCALFTVLMGFRRKQSSPHFSISLIWHEYVGYI